MLPPAAGRTTLWYPPRAVSPLLTTTYSGPLRMPELGAAEREKRRIRREITSWVAGALALLGLAILAPQQVALADTDSTAARNAPARDPALRWQFDSGG